MVQCCIPTTEDNTLQHPNICVISDCKDHTTVTVFAFLKVVLEYLKTELPAVKKIHYFTDGCAGQYKNKKNFINLCHHEDDFGEQNGTSLPFPMVKAPVMALGEL